MRMVILLLSLSLTGCQTLDVFLTKKVEPSALATDVGILQLVGGK